VLRRSQAGHGSLAEEDRMQLRDQAIYCLPDGTWAKAVQQAQADPASPWGLYHPESGALLYTIGPDGYLTGYAMLQQVSGDPRYDPFLTDITIADLLLT
jgi:hypothetical protein